MSESESQKNDDPLPESPIREGEAPPEPASEASNPYQSPEHVGTPARHPEEQSPQRPGMSLWIVCLVFLPLVLGNLFFWPTYLLGLQIVAGSGDAVETVAKAVVLIALPVCGLAGIVYGIFMARYGMRVMYGRDWRDQAATRSRFLPLAIGLSVAQLFWFPASVLGGCLGVVAFWG